MKIETWEGHEIRFVEDNGKWWAVAADVCAALELEQVTRAVDEMQERLKLAGVDGVTSSKVISTPNGYHKKETVTMVNEQGLYELIFASRKKEAVKFRSWVTGEVLPKLREAAGLEQYKVLTFAQSVENHHLNGDALQEAFHPVDKTPYAKAHAITNKAVSNILGLPKSIKKDEIKERYPEMIPIRDEILTDTVNLMTLVERFDLNVSVSAKIYEKWAHVLPTVKEAK
jgi:prophage antirepressor-like protein